MKSLIAAEFLKLRTTRMLPITLGVVAALATAMPIFYGAVAGGSGDIPALTPAAFADMVRGPAAMAGGAVLLTGLLATAGEFRYRTIFTSRLQEPRATRLLTAKLVTLAALGLVVGIVMEALSVGVGAAVLAQHDVAVRPLSHDIPRIAAVLPVAIALQGVLGVAIGALLRNTATAVGTTLVWAFIVERIIPMVAGKPHVIDWLPSGALKAVASTHDTGRLAPAAAAAVLLAYTAVMLAAAIALDRRREL